MPAFFNPKKMSSTAENLARIQSEIGEDVTLVAVTKNRPLEQVRELYDTGYRIFGENRVQDLVEKHQTFPKDVQWHLIGHLQTNKVKYIAPFVSLIHSVDSLKLLQQINKEAQKNNRIIPCLLQFYIASEETKFGLSLDEGKALLADASFVDLKNIVIVGVMGMASNAENTEQVKREFQHLKAIFKTLKQTFFQTDLGFKEISMGMSNDYLLAIEEGSTMVRVGSALFAQ
jgi:pyridoxal phosphate enzyme (YggS family)